MQTRMVFALIHADTYHLLVDQVCQEAQRGQTHLFVISLEAFAELNDQPLQDQLSYLRELKIHTIIKILIPVSDHRIHT